MVENYFKAIVDDQSGNADKDAPPTRSLRGSFKSDDLDHKEALKVELAKKHL